MKTLAALRDILSCTLRVAGRWTRRRCRSGLQGAFGSVVGSDADHVRLVRSGSSTTNEHPQATRPKGPGRPRPVATVRALRPVLPRRLTLARGRVFCYCRRAARQREGTCARCGHHGVVPGQIDGQPTCVDCSGVPVDVRCRRCGREAPMGFAVTCWRRQLEDQLTRLLADPDGSIPPILQPFVDALVGLTQPPDRLCVDAPQPCRADHLAAGHR